MKSKQTPALNLVKLCYQVLDDKKAADITILNVSEQSSITDYLVLATATSAPHLRALRVELEKALDAGNIHLVGMDTAQDSGWMVIDAFDVMVHLFLAETRERYGLERLWRDATEVPATKVGGAPAKPAKKPAKMPAKKPARKVATKVAKKAPGKKPSRAAAPIARRKR